MGSSYWYDEVIVTNISKQSFTDIFSVVLAEPHPVGFYIFLKLFSTNDPVATRLLLGITSIMLYLVTFIFIYLKRGILPTWVLFGVTLFATSPFGVDLAFNIRNESITVPLMVLAFLVLYSFYREHKILDLVVIVLLNICLLCFGYIVFAKVLLATTFVVLIKKSRSGYYALGLLALITVLYLYFYGYTQFFNNIHRFSWQLSQYNNVSEVISESLGGKFPKIADFVLLALFTPLVISFHHLQKRNVYKIYSVLVVLISIYFILGGVARSRYVADLILCVFMVVSYGYSLLQKYTSRLYSAYLLLTIALLMSASITSYYDFNSSNLRYKTQNLILGETVGRHTVGFLSQHPIDSYIRKIGYLSSFDNIHPLYLGGELRYTGNVYFDLLMKDGTFTERTTEENVELLKDSGHSRFVFIATSIVSKTLDEYYFDPNQTILSALNAYCSKKDIVPFYSRFIIHFSDCVVPKAN